ncbi:FadR family transcriptional regulator [Spiractinospora alimapuensis]|uniref:FadR/GntR family transcriptional regulator n=1 Tax=Spiractinospora alimapuensis TaxID=2820884 RepID=UPI001F3FEDCB|nr:FadR/GntR family transcriptional regulator [Spiractinospora alimapuensis]QVQ54662.1 FadR family transcriptional regulator [Spiractinospora alimapuensis]
MPLASTRRTGLVEQVITQIRTQIDSGEWRVGDRIPTETELSDQLEVGRNTVREAVRALAHTGLLEIRQGAGTFVRASSELAGALRRRVERGKLRETLEVRRALEVEAARLAATRRTDTDLEELNTQLRRRKAAHDVGDPAAFVDSDVALHRAVVRASHSPLLIELYSNLTPGITEGIASMVLEDGTETVPIDHTPLVAAIRDRDPDAAAQETTRFIDELLEENQD